MFFDYAAYLAVILFGALAILFFFRIDLLKQPRRLFWTLVLTAVFFVAWDVLAVQAGHWSFGSFVILGYWVLNQPIEEIAFFLVVPFFYIVVWETMKRGLNAK